MLKLYSTYFKEKDGQQTFLADGEELNAEGLDHLREDDEIVSGDSKMTSEKLVKLVEETNVKTTPAKCISWADITNRELKKLGGNSTPQVSVTRSGNLFKNNSITESTTRSGTTYNR